MDDKLYCLQACTCALFSPEILQAGGVKGLRQHRNYNGEMPPFFPYWSAQTVLAAIQGRDCLSGEEGRGGGGGGGGGDVEWWGGERVSGGRNSLRP